MALCLTTTSRVVTFCYFILFIYFLALIVDHNTCFGILDAFLIFAIIEYSLLVESLISYTFFSGFLPTYWLFRLILLLRLLFCHYFKFWCVPKPLPLVLCSCHPAHFPRRHSCTRGFRCDSRRVACLLGKSFCSGLAAVSDTGSTAEEIQPLPSASLHVSGGDSCNIR